MIARQQGGGSRYDDTCVSMCAFHSAKCSQMNISTTACTWTHKIIWGKMAPFAPNYEDAPPSPKSNFGLQKDLRHVWPITFTPFRSSFLLVWYLLTLCSVDLYPLPQSMIRNEERTSVDWSIADASVFRTKIQIERTRFPTSACRVTPNHFPTSNADLPTWLPLR